jgi:hypothetical protein
LRIAAVNWSLFRTTLIGPAQRFMGQPFISSLLIRRSKPGRPVLLSIMWCLGLVSFFVQEEDIENVRPIIRQFVFFCHLDAGKRGRFVKRMHKKTARNF